MSYKEECKEYARKLLIENACHLDCYRGDFDNALRDVEWTIADGSVHPFSSEEIATALVEIGNEQPMPIEKHKPYMMVWSNEDCSDGIECDTLEKAIDEAQDTLSFWACCEWNDKEYPLNVESWTEEQRGDWDCMIYDCYTEVYKFNEETGEYEEFYELSDEECKKCGWLTVDEMIQMNQKK